MANKTDNSKRKNSSKTFSIPFKGKERPDEERIRKPQQGKEKKEKQ